ncbi:unnamed protein product, partial [Sphagnum compactum]
VFDDFDLSVWEHEVSLYGGYNGEFEWYTNDRQNSYTKDGKLYITPTLTYKYLPCQCQDQLYNYALNLWDIAPNVCTVSDEEGCYMQGSSDKIITPIRSARIKTSKSFRFCYGKIEISAKLPAGAWLWPAVWMLPADNVYGGWPRSGEIDIIESRGNDQIIVNGVNIGNEQVLSTLHFGTWDQAAGTSVNDKGFVNDFHIYKMEWTPDYIEFQVDNNQPWRVSGPFANGYTGSPNKMAPFDQQFYFIVNLGVGGILGYFPDNAWYPIGKPWQNADGRRTGQTKFWWSEHWISYENDPEQSSLQLDYIKVWAI